MAEGFRYAFGFAPIRAILLLLALVSFMGMPYTVLMPIFAADVLHGGPYTLGFLTAASGVGALAGRSTWPRGRRCWAWGGSIVVATVLFGLGLVGFALSRQSCGCRCSLMVVTGFGMMVQMAASNTILQTIVDEDKRGRVMSFYSMAFLGMAPFGSLFAGVLAGDRRPGHGAGRRHRVPAWRGWCSPCSCRRLRELVRPIYVRLGILPEVAGARL